MKPLPLFSVLPPALAAPALRAVKGALFALALLPLARLVWLGLTGALGANPVEFLLRSLGTWTLVALLATLSISPLRWLTGWQWLLRLRRMLGLFAFFYSSLHVLTYVWLDQFFDLQLIVADVLKRPYLTFGFAAFVLMIPLAITSTNAWVKRLGGRRWQLLHRLVYASAVLGVLHYWYHKVAKNDLAQPTLYAIVLGVLLGARVLHALDGRRRRSAS